MITEQLTDTARALVADNKGLLAMDESVGTCNKRFAALGIPQTIEMRRRYREMIVTTPALNESISGAILFDETIRQQKTDGTSFINVLIDAGIIPAIKVDIGAKMIQNLAWATGYNVIALPLAAGVLYNQGIVLSPAIGAILMTISTVVVAINASLLKVESRD